ncbi:MAG: dacB, partial [Chitinophagaceae bacterium]|nr:dacB [Chitinophagaceae bacterium]
MFYFNNNLTKNIKTFFNNDVATRSKCMIVNPGVLLCLVSFFCFLTSFGQDGTSDSLRFQLKALERTPLLSRGTIGLWVQNQETNEVLINYNAEKSFIPASNLKVVTTASALAILGEDYKFITKGYI